MYLLTYGHTMLMTCLYVLMMSYLNLLMARRAKARAKYSLFRPSDRDLMATDRRESYYFGVLNKIYLQNFLHGWVVNHETNLMSIFNS